MPTHLDGALFGDAFATPGTRAIFDQSGFVERFLRVEAELALTRAEEDVIPVDAAEAIADGADADLTDDDLAVQQNLADRLTDPTNYTGLAGRLVDRVLD